MGRSHGSSGLWLSFWIPAYLSCIFLGDVGFIVPFRYGRVEWFHVSALDLPRQENGARDEEVRARKDGKYLVMTEGEGNEARA